MTTATGQSKDSLLFGPFNLIEAERLLMKGDAPVDLGARAFDILIALTSSPNEVVSKKDLISRVWPDVTVEEGSLRFHMASLRKALGDGHDGARYITTLAGRGYCFVAPVSRGSSAPAPAPAAAARFSHTNLPGRIGRIIGRDDDVRKLSAELIASRFVTVVGTGGVGKTTVAVAVAHHLADEFGGAALFVDLGALADPKLAPTAIASMLGQSVRSEDATDGLLEFLRTQRVLLLLDTCEHLIEAVAELAARIMEAAPRVHILATSREALRVDGERVYRLDALAYPPDATELTADTIRQFPAIELFIERALANGAQLSITDTEAPLVASICRKLDGVALAIELAARRVESHGLQQISTLLDERLARSWQGSRTAPQRQRTLQATLDWSYGLLSEQERMVLRRMAIFVGAFTLDAVLDVVAGPPLDRAVVFNVIDSLVAKSMLATRPIGAMMRYRLLDTTRAYALEIGLETTEATELATRHAAYYRRWLEQSGTEWSTLTTGTERAPHFAGLNNVRAALEWCFGEDGAAALGVELAAAATPVFLAMSLLPECHRWSERALGALDKEHRGGSDEMQLQASLGLSLMYIRGHSQEASAALNRSIEIARARNDHVNEVRLLGPLFFYHMRGGEFRTCLDDARRCAEIAGSLNDPGAKALAHTLLGITLTLMGELDAAQTELDLAIDAGRRSPGSRAIHFGFDHYRWVRVARITVLALQGHPEQAEALIEEAFADVSGLYHPVSLATVISSTAALIWIGDYAAADAHLDWFFVRAKLDSFAPYHQLGHAFQGELAICRGDFASGVEILQTRVARLHASGYRLFTMRLQGTLARGLAACGRWSEALRLVAETGQMIAEKGYTSYLPELLRLKGTILLAMPERQVAEAESCFVESLKLSRSQGARAWEMRAATDLAAHWAELGRKDEARALLQPVFAQFTEGLDTPDLLAAKALLKTLG
ncbi:winged helix-turn-helix domain-containing protein [Desertibaculum subflavum]|uniref:winged helix-turn-helix domain-containing protein n=1 Tax=Desertibaculum subflavum TaxID=2268458 RepID=UPI000E6720E6